MGLEDLGLGSAQDLMNELQKNPFNSLTPERDQWIKDHIAGRATKSP